MALAHRPASQGRYLQTLKVAGFTLIDSLHAPAVLLPRHAHDQATVCFVKSGGFTEVLGSRSEDYGPLSLIIKPPGTVHANQYGPEGARCLVIEIDNQRLESIRTYAPVLEQPVHMKGGIYAFLATRLYRELKEAGSSSMLSIEGLTLELLAEAWGPRDSGIAVSAHRLARAEEYLQERFSDPIGLTDVARAVGVHPGHLARVFRKRHRCTVGDYLRSIRLNWAAERLTNTDLAIAEIATNAGFYDQSHLTNSFKLRTGMTPSAFRKANTHSPHGKYS